MTRREAKDALFEQFARVGKALSSPARLELLNLLATRKDGAKVYYRLAGGDVAALYAGVQQVSAAHLGDLAPARDAYLGPDDTP